MVGLCEDTEHFIPNRHGVVFTSPPRLLQHVLQLWRQGTLHFYVDVPDPER
jgi:hypothetical protein